MSLTANAWTMPSETHPQERVFMAFPPLGESFGTTDDAAADARDAWATVANAAVDFVPVSMLVNPPDFAHAKRLLSREVSLVEAPLNDAWMRDIGPTFVLNESGRLGAVTWQFNGWGQQAWARWDKDRFIAHIVADLAGAEVIESELVNEGGGIHVDGMGTILLTDTVQLDRHRNPDWSRHQIEAELNRTLSAQHFIWFPRGLHRDSQRFGTRGHIDIVATIPSPGRILVHRQEDPAHPDFHLTEVFDTVVAESETPEGEPWEVLGIAAPKNTRDDQGWTDYSYVNHLVTNGAVISCTFDDPNDASAAEVLAAAYPGRDIVGVDARNLFRYGGGIHCITQQQPVSNVRP